MHIAKYKLKNGAWFEFDVNSERVDEIIQTYVESVKNKNVIVIKAHEHSQNRYCFQAGDVEYLRLTKKDHNNG